MAIPMSRTPSISTYTPNDDDQRPHRDLWPHQGGDAEGDRQQTPHQKDPPVPSGIFDHGSSSSGMTKTVHRHPGGAEGPAAGPEPARPGVAIAWCRAPVPVPRASGAPRPPRLAGAVAGEHRGRLPGGGRPRLPLHRDRRPDHRRRCGRGVPRPDPGADHQRRRPGRRLGLGRPPPPRCRLVVRTGPGASPPRHRRGHHAARRRAHHLARRPLQHRPEGARVGVGGGGGDPAHRAKRTPC